MKRTGNLKRRESKNLPPEKLHEILSKIYPDRVVDEIFPKLIKCETTEKDGKKKWKKIYTQLFLVFILPLVIIGSIVYGILYLIQLFCRTIMIYFEKGITWIDKNITSNL